MTGCTLSGESAVSAGGGVANGGTLTMTGCTLSGDVGGSAGGGFMNGGGTLTMTGCTLSGDYAGSIPDHILTGHGGGGFNNSTLTMAGCTLSRDSANLYGGGVANYGGALTMTGCTVSGNSAPHDGGLHIAAGSATLTDTIVAANAAPFGAPDIGGPASGQLTGTYNLIGTGGSGGLRNGVNGNIVLTSLKGLGLASLGDYGGPTQTVPLLPGSPAIAAGTPVPGLTADQRGLIRGNVVDIGAFQSSLEVESPAATGVTTAAGLTLPGAVALADQYAGAAISFDPAAFASPQTITLAGALLELSDTALSTSITGPGANVLTVDAQGDSGILSIESGADVIVSGLTLAHGSAVKGGAISNAGTLALTDCTLTGNTATAGVGPDGGAIFNTGTLSLIGCTLSANKAFQYGGAVYSGGGSLTLLNCTVSGNSANSAGGGIYCYLGTTLTLANCTVSGNSAIDGGGILGRNVTMNNTIVAGSSSAGGDIRGRVSGSYNLIDDAAATGGLSNGVDGNIVGVDPKLGPLADNGGPTPTMALLPGSPAIDAGSDALIAAGVTTDQRGAPRINGTSVDIGAYEDLTRVAVNTLADTAGPPAGSALSLRQAIGLVETFDPSGGTITFAPGLSGTIALSSPLPAIAGSLAIAGPGANLLTIDAAGNSGILSIDPGITVDISGLTLANGSASPIPGGAITTDGGGAIANRGTLAVFECALTGNSAIYGGAISNTGTLTLVDSTLSGNTAFSEGGAVYSTGSVTLTDCTISGNSAGSVGGGIYRSGYSQPGTSLTLADCTISGNSASLAGGIAGHNVTMNNTIVANSGLGGDLYGTVSGSNNLIEDAGNAGGLASGVDGNLVGVDPKLGTLAYNGGSTQTMADLAGSPAIDKGDNNLVPIDPSTGLPFTTDQAAASPARRKRHRRQHRSVRGPGRRHHARQRAGDHRGERRDRWPRLVRRFRHQCRQLHRRRRLRRQLAHDDPRERRAWLSGQRHPHLRRERHQHRHRDGHGSVWRRQPRHTRHGRRDANVDLGRCLEHAPSPSDSPRRLPQRSPPPTATRFRLPKATAWSPSLTARWCWAGLATFSGSPATATLIIRAGLATVGSRTRLPPGTAV